MEILRDRFALLMKIVDQAISVEYPSRMVFSMDSAKSYWKRETCVKTKQQELL